jgi:hypothetical protein
VLRRLKNLDQALALSIDLFGEGCQDLGALQRILSGLDMVGTDRFDYIVVTAVVGLLGSASSAKEAVGRSFELGVVAACGADYSSAVCLKASSARLLVIVRLMSYAMVVLDNARYVLRELADTRTPELEYYPASRQVLFFRVSYPLGLVCVSICECRHV